MRAVCRHEPDAAAIADGETAAQALRNAGYALTEVTGRGREGAVDILHLVVPRRKVRDAVHILQEHDPDVFVTVEEVRSTRGGYLQLGGRKMPILGRV